MKEFKVLKFLDLFRGFFEKSKVDYDVMRSILKVKLAMDRRRSATIVNRGNNSGDKSSFGWSIFLYMFIGGMMAIYMAMPLPVFVTMSIILSVVMMFITLTMVADFSSVLLDLKDKNIILRAPVDYKTLNMAKTVHIVIYLSTIMAAFNCIPLAVSLFRYGIGFFMIFLLELICMSISVIFFTSIIYYVILSLFDGEKLKDMINYVQIIFTIVITIGQQVASRLFSVAERNFHAAFTLKWWCYLIPSFWMSAPMSMLEEGNFSTGYICLSILSIVMPLILFIVYIKLIAPKFEAKLQKMGSVENGSRRGRLKEWYFNKRSELLCRSSVERGIFNFIINITSTERKLKLALYPSLAMSAIFPFLFIFMFIDTQESFGDIITDAAHGRQYLFMYMAVLIISTSMMLISKSENYKAAWIYKTAPIEKPSMVYRAAIKAVISKYAVPIYSFQAILFLALCGVRILPDLIVMFLNIILVSMIMMALSPKTMPFSREFNSSNGDNTGMAFLVMIIAGIMAGIHFGLTYIKGGVIILGVVVLIVLIVMWKKAFNFGWDDIVF